ncbi:MAG: hypothetical protein WD045_16970 [Pirellulaceae bacterium]
MIDPKQHADNRGMIESILRYIPGFSGYLEKEYRRESDALTRKWLADRLQRSKQALDEYGHTLVNLGQIDQLPVLERMRSRLDRTISRLRGQMPGYSGFFDYVQVDQGLLDDIYDHDLAMIKRVDGLAEKLEQLPSSGQAPLQVVPAIQAEVDQVLADIDRREDLLKGIGTSQGPA